MGLKSSQVDLLQEQRKPGLPDIGDRIILEFALHLAELSTALMLHLIPSDLAKPTYVVLD